MSYLLPSNARTRIHDVSLLTTSPRSLPVAFYVKLFGHEISAREKLGCYAIMTVSTTLSVIGTVWAFLPKSVIGAE